MTREKTALLPLALGGMRMHMAMPVMRLDRHHDDMAVTYAALGDDMIGERLHLGAAPLQHRDLETAVMIDVDVQCRLREIMMLVIVAGQPLRQFARGMIVDIAQG